MPLAKRARRSAKGVTPENDFYKHTETHGNVVRIEQFHTRPPQQVKNKIRLLPKNLAQERYIEALEDPSIKILFAAGPAGTGKTMLATLAGIKQLQAKTVDRIIITRPAISVDEQHGFLPGNLVEKMQPWVLPILDYFYQVYSKRDVLKMIEFGDIEIAPLAYMRGRTFTNAWIIGDEMQNATPNQMKMLCTRIGFGSTLIITGDVTQHDRGFDDNGLKDIMNRYNNQEGIAVCRFSQSDVERHPIIETVLKMYE